MLAKLLHVRTADPTGTALTALAPSLGREAVGEAGALSWLWLHDPADGHGLVLTTWPDQATLRRARVGRSTRALERASVQLLAVAVLHVVVAQREVGGLGGRPGWGHLVHLEGVSRPARPGHELRRTGTRAARSRGHLALLDRASGNATVVSLFADRAAMPAGGPDHRPVGAAYGGRVIAARACSATEVTGDREVALLERPAPATVLGRRATAVGAPALN